MNEPLRCRLVYDGHQAAEPLLYRLGRGSVVQVEVLSETICARRGTLFVAFRGEEPAVAGALADLRSAGVSVEIEARP